MKLATKSLSLTLVVAVVFATGYAGTSLCILLDESTIAYWGFDEGEGDVLTDASENAHDGKIEGAVWIDGKHGKALEFDGKEAFVEVSDADTLHTTDLTVTAWINVYSDPHTWVGSNAAGVVYKHQEFQWNVENTGLLWFGIWGAALKSNYNFTDRLNEWHHIAVTFEGATQECMIYVDGELDNKGTAAEQVDATANRLVIGGKDEPAGPPVEEFFHGAIDEVEMSSVVRDQAEIETSMASIAVNSRGKLANAWGSVKARY